jgi:hypothetical protein
MRAKVNTCAIVGLEGTIVTARCAQRYPYDALFSITSIFEHALMAGVTKIAYMKCRHCESEDVVNAGLNPSGSQRYLCKACRRHFTPEPNPMGYSERYVSKLSRGSSMARTSAGLGVI